MIMIIMTRMVCHLISTLTRTGDEGYVEENSDQFDDEDDTEFEDEDREEEEGDDEDEIVNNKYDPAGIFDYDKSSSLGGTFLLQKTVDLVSAHKLAIAEMVEVTMTNFATWILMPLFF